MYLYNKNGMFLKAVQKKKHQFKTDAFVII